MGGDGGSSWPFRTWRRLGTHLPGQRQRAAHPQPQHQRDRQGIYEAHYRNLFKEAGGTEEGASEGQARAVQDAQQPRHSARHNGNQQLRGLEKHHPLRSHLHPPGVLAAGRGRARLRVGLAHLLLAEFHGHDPARKDLGGRHRGAGRGPQERHGRGPAQRDVRERRGDDPHGADAARGAHRRGEGHAARQRAVEPAARARHVLLLGRHQRRQDDGRRAAILQGGRPHEHDYAPARDGGLRVAYGLLHGRQRLPQRNAAAAHAGDLAVVQHLHPPGLRRLPHLPIVHAHRRLRGLGGRGRGGGAPHGHLRVRHALRHHLLRGGVFGVARGLHRRLGGRVGRVQGFHRHHPPPHRRQRLRARGGGQDGHRGQG
mmetsp:Transcript_31058/g.82277  ORF Transcript_31058/g.82277 Transcript_31058/m.82277 type:complete len:371 (+) Transcript_31058:159-1271(+)